MSFTNWVEKNYNNLVILAQKIDSNNGLEVLHFTIDKFLVGDLELLDSLTDDNKLRYMSRTLSLQSKSKSSQFYREVKRFTIITDDVILPQVEEGVEELEYREAQLDFIEKELNNINWFSSLLFRRYCETNYSAQKLADRLVIPLSTVQYHLRKVKTHIRNKWEQEKHLYI